MRAQWLFITTLCLALAIAWLTSGQRFLDWVFLIPDVGKVDEIVISLVVAAEDWKQGLELEDKFSQSREWLHRVLGIIE